MKECASITCDRITIRYVIHAILKVMKIEYYLVIKNIGALKMKNRNINQFLKIGTNEKFYQQCSLAFVFEESQNDRKAMKME